jgi:hypothetical protein
MEYKIGFITRFSRHKSKGGLYKGLDAIVIFYTMVWKYFVEVSFLREPESPTGLVTNNFYA